MSENNENREVITYSEAIKVQFNKQIVEFYSQRMKKDAIKKSWTVNRVREVIQEIKSGKLAESRGEKKVISSIIL